MLGINVIERFSNRNGSLKLIMLLIYLGSGSGNSGMQRLTLVSPQGTAVPLNAATQRLVLAAASQQGAKIEAGSVGGKAQVSY